MTDEKQEPAKGDRIRFIHGKYKGKDGWWNLAQTFPETSNDVHVMVSLSATKEKPTHVRFTSIRPEHKAPCNRVQAAFQQYPAMEAQLAKLCQMLTACGLGDEQDLSNFIVAELASSKRDLNRQGDKAQYKHVVYDAGTAQAME